MKHYTSEELEGYRNGDMSVSEHENCTRHLTDCQECRARFDELKEDDKLLATIRRNFARFNAVLSNREVRKK